MSQAAAIKYSLSLLIHRAFLCRLALGIQNENQKFGERRRY